MRWALVHGDTAMTRSSPELYAPLIFAAVWLWLAWRCRVRGSALSAPLLGLGVAALFCTLAARVTLPPLHDVSFLARPDRNSIGVIARPVVTLRGRVADFPDRGEFNTDFPLECAEGDFAGRQRVLLHGRVWLRVPRAVNLRVGDAIQATTELSDLPRAGNPGEREYLLRYIENGCWVLGRVRAANDVRALQARPRNGFLRRVEGARTALLAHYAAGFAALGVPFPDMTGQLLTAMAFGEGGLQEPLPRQTRDEFRAAGMSHILVASGTQVSFIVLMLLGAVKVLGARKWPLLILLLPVLLAYGFLAGGAASIWRATIAGVCVAWALLQGRDVDALTLWCLAIVSLLFVDPLQLFSLSFQLSFAATWGLIVAGPVVRSLFQGALGNNLLTDSAAFSIAAQAGVAPLAGYHFGTFSLAGLGANLIGIPLAGVLVGAAVLDWLLPLAPVRHANYFLTSAIAGAAHLGASAPGAQLEAPPVRLLWTATLYGALVATLFFASQRGGWRDHLWLPLQDVWRRWRTRHSLGRAARNSLLLLFCVAALLLCLRAWNTRPQPLYAALLDVGQGESTFVRGPLGRTVLIDGGTESQAERGDVGRTVIVPFLQSQSVGKLDALIITHADADHCNGLLAVVREVPVGIVIDGAQQGDASAAEYLQLRQELARREIPVIAAHAGQQLNLGGGARIKVISPLDPPLRGENSDNNNAAVVKLEFGKTSILLTADIEREAEERLARRGADLRCTILKVAHHGSQTSTQETFLRAAAPNAAIISCGRYNRFGHPRPEVLRRLWERKVPTFRTDVSGAIEVSCDGQNCWVQTQR
jgi:competence protein ComEC